MLDNVSPEAMVCSIALSGSAAPGGSAAHGAAGFDGSGRGFAQVLQFLENDLPVVPAFVLDFLHLLGERPQILLADKIAFGLGLQLFPQGLNLPGQRFDLPLLIGLVLQQILHIAVQLLDPFLQRGGVRLRGRGQRRQCHEQCQKE